MTIVTTPTIARKEITTYCGLVAAEVVEGADALADFAANVRDAVGGRSTSYERLFAKSRKTALAAIESQAEQLGANAIVDVRFFYQVLGEKNGMLMVAASGTAVLVHKTADEKKADDLHRMEEEPDFFVEIKGAEKGPFSLAQIRELLAQGTVEHEAAMRSDRHSHVAKISDLVPVR